MELQLVSLKLLIILTMQSFLDSIKEENTQGGSDYFDINLHNANEATLHPCTPGRLLENLFFFLPFCTTVE